MNFSWYFYARHRHIIILSAIIIFFIMFFNYVQYNVPEIPDDNQENRLESISWDSIFITKLKSPFSKTNILSEFQRGK